MSNPLQENPEISHGDTLALFARALRYAAPFKERFALKLTFGVVSLLPLVLLPWPVKILVDYVIEGMPIGTSLTPIPALIRPAVNALAGLSPLEIVLYTIGFQGLCLLLVGAIGTSARETDHTEAYLSSGHDTATRTENEANAGFSLSGGVLGYLDFRLTIRLTQAINHHYRSQLFERIQALPISSFDEERIGDAVYRVMYDTPSITNSIYRIILTPVLSAILILLTVWMLESVFGSHPTLIWTALAFLPVALLTTLPFAASLRRRSQSSRAAGATSTSTVEEGMTNILAVQSLGGEERERSRFDRDSWNAFGEYRGMLRTVLVASAVAIVPAFALFAYAFLYSVDLVIAGAISLGDFTLLLTYFSAIVFASVEVGAVWFRIQGSAAGLQRVFFLMDQPAELEAPGARELPPIEEGLRVENVSYSFPDGSEAVRDASLEVSRGKVTAVVGPAGAGKTTLAYLLCGFLEPTRGRVLADDVDLRDFTRDSIRSQIAFVFQETALFDDTVEANIRLGKPNASETEVRRAARTAGADEFIRNLPQGYATPLGRAGGKLSVGQKQRLAIARALVRDARVLVLDEPTSALDPETERRLVSALHEASRERAVMVIAHRLSTVRAADEILFLDGGRIIERGSHAELMRREMGAYRRFVEVQTPSAA